MIGAELGYRYVGSPLIAAEPGEGPDYKFIEYTPTTWPGARLPHVWLDDGSAMQDRIGYGHGYTLLRLGGTRADTRALEQAFAALRRAAARCSMCRTRRRAISTATISCCCGRTCTSPGAATRCRRTTRDARRDGDRALRSIARSVARRVILSPQAGRGSCRCRRGNRFSLVRQSFK